MTTREPKSNNIQQYADSRSMAGALLNEKGNASDGPSPPKKIKFASNVTTFLSDAGPAPADQGLYNSINRSATLLSSETKPERQADETSSSRERQVVKNDKVKLTERGRPVQRTAIIRNPLHRAESRKRMEDATLEVDVQCIKPRYYRSTASLEGSNDSCAAFENNLLEPCPTDGICKNFSELMCTPARDSQNMVETLSPLSWFLRTNSDKFYDIGWKSTFSTSPVFGDGKAHNFSLALTPESTFEHLPLLSHTDRLPHGSAKDPWSSTIIPVRRLSAASQLPAEILCQIYKNLSPVDFNSARHACRLWYINSLERSLLETMLKRGGWSTSIRNEFTLNRVLSSQAHVNVEWLMSKRIARECALGPDWTGNGFRSPEESHKFLYGRHQPKRTPFVNISTTDFTEIGIHYPGADEPTSGISFTVSSCGKFLMVAHGCLVYIYELNCSHSSDDISEGRHNGALRAVTSVICPRRVLACSMDTSSHRYAIAVLLDGRMSLVCDLTSLGDRAQRLSTSRYRMSQDASLSRDNEYRNRVSVSSSRSRRPHRTQTGQPSVFPVTAAEATQSNFPLDTEWSVRKWEDITQSQIPTYCLTCSGEPYKTTPTSFSCTQPQEHANTLFTPYPLAIETSIPTIYAPLCSVDDMPRSVALCPQRRCVAFGCSSGIELHWVDALTGQDLNRWFPLTAPSDYLYFLPPRPGVDSAKKLRLISSAGRPGERSVIAERYGGIRAETKYSPFWGVRPGQRGVGLADVEAANRAGLSTPSRDNSDHYHAVPLSDGYHILFTDPVTGLLCLGSDAPIGGPTKLLRKIWFASPQGQGSPVAYTGGSDLRWGVRVVAAYGCGAEQGIWFFSVPPDVFAESQEEQGGINLPYSGITSRSKDGNRDWVRWWCNADPQEAMERNYNVTHATTAREDRLWPVQVRGQEIGKCYGVADLAIDAGPAMTIWAFGKDGLAKTWQIDNGNLNVAVNKKTLVMRDGTIRESDSGGDIQMFDSPLSAHEDLSTSGSRGQETFDGSTSMTCSGVSLGQNIWNCHEGSGQNVINFDADGDVLMADLPRPESPVYENWSVELFESVSLARNGREVLFYDRFSGPSYVGRTEVNGEDLVDVVTGIARIDIEIR